MDRSYVVSHKVWITYRLLDWELQILDDPIRHFKIIIMIGYHHPNFKIYPSRVHDVTFNACWWNPNLEDVLSGLGLQGLQALYTNLQALSKVIEIPKKDMKIYNIGTKFNQEYPKTIENQYNIMFTIICWTLMNPHAFLQRNKQQCAHKPWYKKL